MAVPEYALSCWHTRVTLPFVILKPASHDTYMQVSLNLPLQFPLSVPLPSVTAGHVTAVGKFVDEKVNKTSHHSDETSAYPDGNRMHACMCRKYYAIFLSFSS